MTEFLNAGFEERIVLQAEIRGQSISKVGLYRSLWVKRFRSRKKVTLPSEVEQEIGQ